MEKLKLNNLDIKINIDVINKFLDKIEYPILIFDFEIFRNLLHKKRTFLCTWFWENFFNWILVINNKEELVAKNLQNKKLCLFVKTIIPQPNILNQNAELIKHQQQFFIFLTNKLLNNDVKIP